MAPDDGGRTWWSYQTEDPGEVGGKMMKTIGLWLVGVAVLVAVIVIAQAIA